VEEGRRAGRRQTREAGKKLRAKDGPQQWPLLLRLMSRGGCGLTFRGRMRDRLEWNGTKFTPGWPHHQ